MVSAVTAFSAEKRLCSNITVKSVACGEERQKCELKVCANIKEISYKYLNNGKKVEVKASEISDESGEPIFKKDINEREFCRSIVEDNYRGEVKRVHTSDKIIAKNIYSRGEVSSALIGMNCSFVLK